MSKDLTTKKGTIAFTLNQNKDAIFKLLEEGKVYEAKVAAIKALDGDEILKKNPQVSPCKQQMLRARNSNHFLSILATYMTGCKVS